MFYRQITEEEEKEEEEEEEEEEEGLKFQSRYIAGALQMKKKV